MFVISTHTNSVISSERAQERGYSFDEVVEETNRLSDLQELVVNSVDSRDGTQSEIIYREL